MPVPRAKDISSRRDQQTRERTHKYSCMCAHTDTYMPVPHAKDISSRTAQQRKVHAQV